MFHFVFSFFSLIEEVKEQNKVLRGAQRDIDRDRYHIEREKKRIVTHFKILSSFSSFFIELVRILKELEIKKMAKEGNKQVRSLV